ncbi:MAG: hypothetical protein ACLSAP_09630 [Oscillospiraceae bacterium]
MIVAVRVTSVVVSAATVARPVGAMLMMFHRRIPADCGVVIAGNVNCEILNALLNGQRIVCS